MRNLFLLAALVSLIAFGAPSRAQAGDDPFSAATLKALESLIAERSRSYIACSEFPCPDADCAGWAASIDALSQLGKLIGTPQRTQMETSWGDYESRRKTLGYWLEQDLAVSRKHYENLVSQVASNYGRQAEAEKIAEYQRIAINISKAAQLVADFASFKDFLKDQADASRASSAIAEVMAAGQILNAGLATIESAGLIQQAVNEVQRSGKGDPIPQTVAAGMSYAGVVKEAFSGVGDLAAARQAAELAKTQYGQMLDLRSAPLPEAASAEAARKVRAREILALQRSAEANAKHAGEVARRAASAGALVAVKFATLYAESQQQELRDRIDEYKRNRSAEELALIAQVPELESKDARRLALLTLKMRIDETLGLLASCQRSCAAHFPAPAGEVPVGSFTFPTTDAQGKAVQRDSPGKALAWFAGAFAASSRAVTDAGLFRIEDGRARLIPEPPRVAPKQSIRLRVEGARCLVRRGLVSGDGESAKTSLEKPEALFSGKTQTGDYTYTFEPDGMFYEEGAARYKTTAIVTVARDRLLGYWRRTSPAMIIDGRGATVEWLKAPAGIVVSASDGGKAVMAYLPPGGATLSQAFSSPLLPRCTSNGSRLQCRFEAQIGCAGQWYTFEISPDDQDGARFKVTGGELTSSGPDGCARFAHSFLPLDFSLAREPAQGTFERDFPCPAGYRCQ